MFLKWCVPLVSVILQLVEALPIYQVYSEGECPGIKPPSVKNFDRRALDDMKYILGGSKYHLLHIAATHPLYEDIREEDLVQSFCLQRNLTIHGPNNGTGHSIGLGRTLASFDIVIPPEVETELYLESIPKDLNRTWDFLQETVTLTDNKNYAFIVTCWSGVDQVGWYVMSRSPRLTQQQRMIVEEHAKDIGFDPKNFLFLKRENCGRLLGRNEEELERRRRPVNRVQNNNDIVPLEIRQQRLQRLKEQEEQDRKNRLVTTQRAEVTREVEEGDERETYVKPDIVHGRRYGEKVRESHGWRKPI